MNMLRSTTEEVSYAAVCAAKALEDQLHHVELRFNSTIDHLADLVLIKDGEGRWKTLNKAGQEVFKFHHGEFFDKTDVEISEEFSVFKESLEICSRTDQLAWDLKRPYRVEEMKIPNGSSYYTFDVVKTPVFDESGNPKEMVIVGRDVTEIREKQRRTKACFHALNSASDVIAIIDNHCRIFFCNDRFVEQFGVGDYNDCIDRKLEEVIGEIDPDMWATVQTNKSWTGEFQDYKLSVLPMMNGQPKPIYHVCTFKLLN